jgi:hypothetical protein
VSGEIGGKEAFQFFEGDITKFGFLNASDYRVAGGKSITHSNTFIVLSKAADIPRRNKKLTGAIHGKHTDNNLKQNVQNEGYMKGTGKQELRSSEQEGRIMLGELEPSLARAQTLGLIIQNH